MKSVILLLAVLLAVIPGVDAHGAPDPAEAATRLLADWNDDCGGDGGAAVGSCKGSHDLLALDAQEVYDATHGDSIVFRFTLDKGKSYPITDTLTLTVGSATKTYAYTTQDDASFQNSGFDKLGAPKSIQDGNRFTLEGTVMYSTLGAKPGDAIKGFKIESKATGGVGDFMPGGCHNNVGDCVDTGQSSGQYIAGGGAGSYTLRGNGYYAKITAPSATQQVAANGETTLVIQVKNLLRHTTQQITVTGEASNGATVTLAAGDSTDFTGTKTAGLQANGETTFTVKLHAAGTAGVGTITLTATTDQGGRTQVTIPYEVTTAVTPTTPTPNTGPSKASPTVGLAWGLVGLLALTRLRYKA